MIFWLGIGLTLIGIICCIWFIAEGSIAEGKLFIGIFAIIFGIIFTVAHFMAQAETNQYNELMRFARTHEDSMKIMIEFKKPREVHNTTIYTTH